MKILFDVSPLESLYKTGIPSYTYNLGRALQAQGVILIGFDQDRLYNESQTLRLFEEAEKKWARSHIPKSLNQRRAQFYSKKIKNHWDLFVHKFRTFPSSDVFSDLKADAALILSLKISSVLKNFSGCRIVTFYDFSPVDLRDFHDSKIADDFSELLNKVKSDKSKKTHFVCISKFTRERLMNFLGEEAFYRSCVIYPGIDPFLLEESKKTLPLNRNKIILSVGTLEPRKNLEILVKAFELLHKERPDHILMLIGASGWKNQSLFNLIESSPAKEKIQVLGFVSQEDLAKLYRSCGVFCYPSIYEGFGLPVAEARAFRAPLVVVNNTASMEAAGGNSYFFDGKNIEALANCLRLAMDEKKTPEDFPNEFSWKNSAKHHLALIKSSKSQI